jgi:hypothetical protein
VPPSDALGNAGHGLTITVSRVRSAYWTGPVFNVSSLGGASVTASCNHRHLVKAEVEYTIAPTLQGPSYTTIYWTNSTVCS